MGRGQVHISLKPPLLQAIDQAAKEEMCNRSEFMRRAAQVRLAQHADRHAQLAHLLQAADIPTEEELFELLFYKHRMRLAARMRREIRDGKFSSIRGL